MTLLVLFVLFLGAAFVVPRFIPDMKRGSFDDSPVTNLSWIRWGVGGLFGALAFICMLATSCVFIDQNKVGHLVRIYRGTPMPAGQIIAAPWQKGPQARLLMPGFHFDLFIKVWFDVDEKDKVKIAEGQYGELVAKDGQVMPRGQSFAPQWEKGDVAKMLNASHFLGFDTGKKKYTGPKGVKGPQSTVLPPGEYRINRFLFSVVAGAATDIKTGYVGVIKANFGDIYEGEALLPEGLKSTTLSVPIVPKGYRGVWDETLKPARYYINTKAFDIFTIPTQVQVWKYIGGYKRRHINLYIGNDGQIKQDEDTEDVLMPEDAADRAVLLRVEGWEVHQDARIQVQVKPVNAPYVVAAVGGLKAIEDKIITPTFRSVLRNEVAKDIEEEVKGKMTTRPRKVLDLLYKRAQTEKAVLQHLIPEGNQVGLTIMNVRFGDPAVPPELLIPGKRQQLAEQLSQTYQQEKLAQVERVKAERERARADQQPVLMKSEIGIKVAENKATARKKLGLGEKAYMEAVAKGQLAQKKVLGEDRTFELSYLKEVMATYEKVAIANPDAIKMPNILVMGQGGGLEGAAAILGANNINFALKRGAKTTIPSQTK